MLTVVVIAFEMFGSICFALQGFASVSYVVSTESLMLLPCQCIVENLFQDHGLLDDLWKWFHADCSCCNRFYYIEMLMLCHVVDNPLCFSFN